MTGVLLGTTFSILLLFLGAAVYIGATLGSLGLILGFIFSDRPLYMAIGDLAWTPSTSFVLVAVPLFILMGEILLRSGITDRLYTSLGGWLNFLPGGLMHTNIASCSVFAAVSGSSVATAATIGTVALPAFERAGYNERLVLGSLAAGGTLGILIPPSINMIIYGLLTDTSIGRLFFGGFIPGFLLAGIFMLFIAAASAVNPGVAPKEVLPSMKERIKGLSNILPMVFLILVVMGSIYLGWATPTEAAALGVVGSLILALVFRRLNFKMLSESTESTARTGAMVTFIVIGAFLFNFFITALGLPRAITSAITELGIPPLATLGLLIIFYLVLGMFMETLSIMVTTLPVTFPVIHHLAMENPEIRIFDPVAYGILFVILIESALITPPVGVNLYVIQGIRKTVGPMTDVIVGAVPFFICMVIMMGIIIAFPDLALWLPNMVFD